MRRIRRRASCPRPASSSRSSCPTGEGVRVDSGVAEGDEVTPFYDPMIAKVIAHGASREEALERLSGALASTIVAGPRCNVAFLKSACRHARNSVRARSIPASSSAISKISARARKPPDAQAIVAGTAQLLRMEYEKSNPSLLVRGRLGSQEWLYDPWSARKGFELAGRRHTIVPVATESGKVECRSFLRR